MELLEIELQISKLLLLKVLLFVCRAHQKRNNENYFCNEKTNSYVLRFMTIEMNSSSNGSLFSGIVTHRRLLLIIALLVTCFILF